MAIGELNGIEKVGNAVICRVDNLETSINGGTLTVGSRYGNGIAAGNTCGKRGKFCCGSYRASSRSESCPCAPLFSIGGGHFRINSRHNG